MIVDPGSVKDIVAQHVNVGSLLFQQEFTLVYQEPFGLRLYHRNGLPPLPTRPVAPYLASLHNLCRTGEGTTG